jgi:hypothetical protein
MRGADLIPVLLVPNRRIYLVDEHHVEMVPQDGRLLGVELLHAPELHGALQPVAKVP